MKNPQKGSTTTVVLIVILLLVIVFGTYYYSSNASWIKQQINSPQQPQAQAPVSVPVQTIVKKIGDSFVLWDFEYKVTSATTFHPAYDFQKTTGKYIGIKIKVTNNGKVESGVNKIYVQDSKGRQYQPAMLGYQQLDVEDYGWSKIQAGFTKTLGVIFEVPKDSTGLELEYPSAQGSVVLSVKLGM